MDLLTLMKYTTEKTRTESLPKYPGICRDLAMLVDENISAAEIERVIAKNGGKFFNDVTLFDVFQGKQIAAGMKSMAFNIQFQASDKTLTDAEANEGFNKILEAVKKEFNAELRG